MIILKKKIISNPKLKKLLIKGKETFLDETLDNWNKFRINPGKSINNSIGDMIEHPISNSLEALVESRLGPLGKIPGLKIPGVSGVGNKIEKAVLSESTRNKLLNESNRFRESKIASEIEKKVNKVIKPKNYDNN